MTGTGDRPDRSLSNEPDSQQNQPAPEGGPFTESSPLGGWESFLERTGKTEAAQNEVDSESGSDVGGSIFDEEPDGPIKSLDEIPDAIPNISDGSTEILSQGRAEIQEFRESFCDELPFAMLDSKPSPPGKAGEHSGQGLPPGMVGGLVFDELDEMADSPTAIIAGRQELVASGGPGNDESVVAAAAVATPVVRTAGRSPDSGGHRTLLMALGGYAIIVTVICVVLVSLLARARNANRLESLPDLPPEPARQMTLVPANAELSPGHTLSLGQRQQFGHLRVEPLRVTRGPVHFVYSGDQREAGFKIGPVLKLWVKLTNTSSDQKFVPLDAGLLFRIGQDGKRSNNFVIEKSHKLQGAPCVLVQHDELLKSGEWTLSGQQLGQTLLPGESLETYIPTVEEGIDQLAGDLLWRVQLRKGHSPSGAGVTTLIEVDFPADQIQSEGT